MPGGSSKVIGKQKAQVARHFSRAAGRRRADRAGREEGAGARVPRSAAGDEGEAQDGDLVAATTTKDGRYGLPHAKVRERLGSLKSEKAVSLIAIHAHAIPHVFPPDALAEAEAAKPATLAGPRGLARRCPSSPSIRPTPRTMTTPSMPRRTRIPSNPGGFIVTVAIADVAAYVRPGSALDREALERGNSVYFPDRVVPMLPERISNDLCSLRPREDRPALAVRMMIGADGRKKRHALPPRHDALGGEAVLRAGAGRHRRAAGRRRPARSSSRC